MASPNDQRLMFADTGDLLDELASRYSGLVCAFDRPPKDSQDDASEIGVYFTAHTERHEDLLALASHLYIEVYRDWVESVGDTIE